MAQTTPKPLEQPQAEKAVLDEVARSAPKPPEKPKKKGRFGRSPFEEPDKGPPHERPTTWRPSHFLHIAVAGSTASPARVDYLQTKTLFERTEIPDIMQEAMIVV